MIKLWLMRLNFREVLVVKIPWIFQVYIPESDDTTALIPHSQELSWLVKSNCSQDVLISHILKVSLSKSIYIHPVDVILSLPRSSLRLTLWRNFDTTATTWHLLNRPLLWDHAINYHSICISHTQHWSARCSCSSLSCHSSIHLRLLLHIDLRHSSLINFH